MFKRLDHDLEVSIRHRLVTDDGCLIFFDEIQALIAEIDYLRSFVDTKHTVTRHQMLGQKIKAQGRKILRYEEALRSIAFETKCETPGSPELWSREDLAETVMEDASIAHQALIFERENESKESDE